MEHVVFFPAPDGSPGFKRVGSLEDAVRLVEHLRNVEGVADVSVHALTEVPMAFRAYYRVEVPALAEQGASTAPAEVVVPPQGAPTTAPSAPAEVAPAPFLPEPEASVPQAALDPTVEATGQDAPLASAEPAFAGADGGNGNASANGHREVTGLGFFAS